MATNGPFASSGTHMCQNCTWQGPASHLLGIKDLRQRISAGDPVASGECPKCRALCQPTTPRTVQYLFVMHGGLEPSETLGPYTTAEERDALIMTELLNNSELRAEDGSDTIHTLDLPAAGRPRLGSFSGRHMSVLRTRAWRQTEQDQATRPHP
jgi:hypothetical protein